MNIIIVATKTCNHGKLMAKELDGLGVAYRIAYIEDEPEIAQQYRD